MEVLVYNSLKEHKQKIIEKGKKLNPENEKDFEEFDIWCEENLSENGFIELEEYEDDDEKFIFMVQIDDDEKGWKKKF